MIARLPVTNRLNSDLFHAKISAGVNHCLAIRDMNSNDQEPSILVGWGSNIDKQLGEPQCVDDVIQQTPLPIKLMYGKKEYLPLQVACGNSHSMIIGYQSGLEPEKGKTLGDFLLSQVALKDNNYLVLFSSGNDELGQQGRLTRKEEKPDEKDDEDEFIQNEQDEDDATEECFIIDTTVEIISKIIQVACGSNYTIALDIYGVAYAWGEGSTGCLGNGNFLDSEKPILIEHFGNIKMKFIAAGPAHAAAISEGGELYTWGIGNYGQLGQGSTKSSNIPKPVGGSIKGKICEYVSCGGLHTACVTTDGYAHTFGYNKNGQLGMGDFIDRLEPQKVLAIQNFFVLYCKCGGNNTMIVTYERFVFVCGSNMKGKLGLRDDSGNNYPEPQLLKADYFFAKVREDFLFQLALSYHFGLALTRGGSLLSFGLPFKGVLGRNLQGELLRQDIDPQQLDDIMKNFEDDYDDMVEKNGALTKMLAEVNQDILQVFIQPKPIEGIYYTLQNQDLINKLARNVNASQQVVEVKCGAFHTVALTDAGEIWVWGSNQYLQHGMTDEQIREQVNSFGKYITFTASQKIQLETMPTQVPLFQVRENKRVTYLATGFEYVVVVENRRNVYAWGKNNKGQLGLGFVSDNVETPSRLNDLEGLLIQQVACGEDHTILLNDDGELYAFGSPTDGKLGIGPKQTFALQAQKVNEIRGVVKISVGPHHSMALATDPFQTERVIQTKSEKKKKEQQEVEIQKYVIYTWGSGWGGKLGHGNMDNQYYPKLLQTKYTFKDISAGTNHSGALNQEDKLVVWGIGGYLGMQKPEEDNDNNLGRRRQKNQQEPYYILSPMIHPDHSTKSFFEIKLFDKYNVGINKQDRIVYWGMFDQKLQKNLKEQIEKTSKEQKERIFETIQSKNNYFDLEIKFSNISVSFNHAAVISNNKIEQVSKKEVYTWGFDGMTGRLGLGYEFRNPDKENEMQLENNKKQIVIIQEKIKDVEAEREKPTPLQFINQLIDFNYKQFLIMSELANKRDEEEEEIDENISRPSTTPIRGNKKDQVQLGKKEQANERVKLGEKYGIVEKGEIHSRPLEEVLSQQRPDIYKCTKGATDKSGKGKKVNFFDEKVVDEVYELVSSLDEENQELITQICKVNLKQYKKFKQEAMLTIINKIQREPFKINFSQPENREKQAGQKNKHHQKPEDGFKQITENTHAYKILFSCLQLHPCYLVNFFKNYNIMKDDFVDIVLDVYDNFEKDKRKQRLFINLIILILKIELERQTDYKLAFTYKPDENGQVKDVYVFTKLFQGFLDSFSKNLALFHSIEQITRDEINNVTGIPKNQVGFMYCFKEDQFKLSTLIVKPQLDQNQTVKFFQDRVSFIGNRLGNYFTQLLNVQTNSIAKQVLNKSTRELLVRTYEMVKAFYLQRSHSIESIQSKILGLIFMQFLDRFYDKAKKLEALKSETEKATESKLLNYQCFTELFRMYVNCTQKDRDIDLPWWPSLMDEISKGSQNRTSLFNTLLFKKEGKNQSNVLFDVKKIWDLYNHSIEYSPDIISPRVKTYQILAKALLDGPIENIIYVKAKGQDKILQFKQIHDKAIGYHKMEAKPEELNKRFKIKLETRQLHAHGKKNLKQCQNCECYVVETFMASEDNYYIQRFDQWNPVSLPALLIAIVPCFKSKKEFDDFLLGIYQDVGLFLKKKIAAQKDSNSYENILKLRDFEKAFQEKVKFNKDQSDNVADDEKQVIIKENKKVLRELKMNVEDRLIKIYTYIYYSEQYMFILDKINNNLKKLIASFDSDKKQLWHRILSNCYYGMANKEVIKTLEHNPLALVGKIKDAIKKVDTSQDIYENIDIFKTDLNTPCTLDIFGSYGYNILVYRDIVYQIELSVFDTVRKQTRQILTDERILDRIIYIFQKGKHGSIEIQTIYSEVEIDWKQTLTCGIIKPELDPIEFILDQTALDTSDILSMRKRIIKHPLGRDDQPKKKKIGLTTFFERGILILTDELINHAVIYDHIFQEAKPGKQVKG